MNTPQVSTNALADSIRNGHAAADRAERIIDGILTDLTGDTLVYDDTERPNGLVYSADNLASRLEAIAGRLQGIRERIESPKVVAIEQRAGQGQFNQAAYGPMNAKQNY